MKSRETTPILKKIIPRYGKKVKGNMAENGLTDHDYVEHGCIIFAWEKIKEDKSLSMKK